MNSSRGFLYLTYEKYVDRACEDLGIPKEAQEDENVTMSEKDYPSKFKKFSKEERDEYNKNDTMTDEEFMSQFSEYRKN